jgi:hypothetical protein
MQTCRQSRLEVGADFGVSLAVSFVTQRLFYGALATAKRSLTFAALLRALAVPQRYALRRVFEAWDARQAGLSPYGQPLSSELS